MDDASGNYFGRQLIRDYFFEKMPASVSKEFFRKYRLDASEIKDRLYKKPNPNTYLAKFAKFMIENKDLNYCNKLITKGFSLFIKNQIEQFDVLKEIYLNWNSKINVISRKDTENFYTRHILHSLSIAKFIQFASDTKILEVGTGGGFPGLPPGSYTRLTLPTRA